MRLKLSLLADTVKRFPAASLLAVANAVFIGWAIDAPKGADHLPLACLYASGLAIVLSAFVGLVAERFRPKFVVSLIFQAVVLAVAAGLAWSFLRCDIFELHFYYSYYLTLAAFVALTVMAIGWHQTVERAFPCAVFAGIISNAAALAVGGGLTLVLVAVEKLFGVDVSSKICGTIWGGAWATVGTLFFLAYATRREPFEFPKAWKVLFVYVTLPIYLLLLAVLWAYLGKCIVKWSLPNGQINWLVTLVASMWMVFHLLLGGIDAGIVRLFRRFGVLLIVPLVGLQICALQIRIAEYGLTPSRYASILFVFFALVFAVLSLVRSRWAAPLAYAFFAALALFAAHSHWNIVDTGVRSQLARLEAFRARKAAGETFDKETRYAIMGAWEFADDYTLTNGVYRYRRNWNKRDERFTKEWGFDFVNSYERRCPGSKCSTPQCRDFGVPEGYKIDLSQYSSCVFGQFNRDGQQIRITCEKIGEWKFVTEPFMEAVEKMPDGGPLEFDLPEVGHVLVIDGGMSTSQKEGEKKPTIESCYGDCLILRK